MPVATAHLQPCVLQSVVDPPTVWCGRPPAWLSRWIGKWAYQMGGKYYIDPAFRTTVNDFRRELDLPPQTRLWGDWAESPTRLLGLFPDWYAEAPDWPERLRLVGFVRYDQADVGLPAAVERFLSDGPPPVVVSFGSAMRTGRQHFEVAVEAVRRAGRRGLVLAKGGDQIPPLPSGFHHADYAPFSAVFPQAAAVIHHGGIGTTAQGLAAGVPQLVMPLAFDQFDNAERLRRLGTARVLRPTRFTPDAATRVLDELLTMPEVTSACATAKVKMAADDPVATACRWVEELQGSDRS